MVFYSSGFLLKEVLNFTNFPIFGILFSIAFGSMRLFTKVI
jgi:hypothetical protein